MTAHHNLALRHPPEAEAPSRPAGFAPQHLVHGGVEVIRLDYSHLGAGALAEAFGVAARVIAGHPPGSLRILTILDSSFDARAAEALKQHAVANRPFVRASAVIAVGFWSAVVVTIKLHERRDLRMFGDEAAALDWLAGS